MALNEPFDAAELDVGEVCHSGNIPISLNFSRIREIFVGFGAEWQCGELVDMGTPGAWPDEKRTLPLYKGEIGERIGRVFLESAIFLKIIFATKGRIRHSGFAIHVFITRKLKNWRS